MKHSWNLSFLVCIIFLSVTSASPKKSEAKVKPVSASNANRTETLQPSSTPSSSCSYDEALHLPSETCYTIGSQGPCNEYERWFAKPENESEGECSCLTLAKNCANIVNQPVARSLTDQRCYAVYSKANCEDPNEWFTFQPNSRTVGHCTPNPCGNLSLNGTTQLNETSILKLLGFYNPQKPYPFNADLLPVKPFWFLHENKCVHTFTLGTCDISGSNKTHTLFFRGTRPVPECTDADADSYSCFDLRVVGLPSRENTCPEGYKKVGRDCAYSVEITSVNDYED